MEYYLDTKGYECPIPVLKANKFIKKLSKNDILNVESDDLLAKFDFENYCKENKFKIIKILIENKIVKVTFQI
jgi:tRNA 2-thiouridine synthesizing protein A